MLKPLTGLRPDTLALMRIGFFGGSFDPPHRGHVAVAQAAQNRFNLDHVLLAPTGRQPLKPGGPTASFKDRLTMTTLLCESAGTSGLEPSTLDAPQPDGAPNYTVDTLTRLRASLEQDDEVFVITGADAFLDLRRWRAPEQLLTLADWIVVSRPGLESERLNDLALTPTQRARVHWLGGVHEPVSATEVRARLAASQDCQGLVPDAVLAYIHQHALYTSNLKA